MKLYTDELPKLCCYCPFYYGNSQGAVCKLTGIMTKWNETLGEMQSKCSLQSLSDYTKQVRKEVLQEVIQKFKDETKYDTEDEEYDLSVWAIFNILDQIQGEAK